MDRRKVLASIGAAGLVSAPIGARAGTSPLRLEWVFDNLTTIDDQPVVVEGAPKLIDTPLGRSTLFDGVGDGLFINKHPLAGAKRFAFEAYFRPDGGSHEQRWLYLGEPIVPPYSANPQAAPRFTFEIRVVGDQWYLDAFMLGPTYQQGLSYPDKVYPLGQWFHVAQTYDGTTYRSYVNHVLQGQAEVDYRPQGQGASSIGTRMTHEYYFKGAIRSARFTHAFLEPDQFLPVPDHGRA